MVTKPSARCARPAQVCEGVITPPPPLFFNKLGSRFEGLRYMEYVGSSGMKLSMRSVNTYLLTVYSAPGTVLGAGDPNIS